MTDTVQTEVSDAVTAVSDAVSAAGTLSGASATTLQTLYTTVYAQSTVLNGIVTDLDATLAVGVGTLGGVDPDEMSSFVSTQTTNCQDEFLAFSVKNNIDLIGKNIQLALG